MNKLTFRQISMKKSTKFIHSPAKAYTKPPKTRYDILAQCSPPLCRFPTRSMDLWPSIIDHRVVIQRSRKIGPNAAIVNGRVMTAIVLGNWTTKNQSFYLFSRIIVIFFIVIRVSNLGCVSGNSADDFLFFFFYFII